ncbi:glycerate kinase [Epidermidibacterium keratini]|uniref:Glycerate kinase n=1 Tax=Epidermidibacterium keratini TaxID=1891644 RepID=A0A7L4YJD2_9ACTN|nr:glycerate kinase [Epidermidibacterium keratini]QHB99211.1 glycerate kinase [Epidermidibacterium keratini]
MKVVIAPDSFGDTLSAPQAAEAIAAGFAQAASGSVELATAPMSDGGPGFIDALATGLPDARRVAVPTLDPLGRAVEGSVLLAAGGAAYIESAQAAGLALVSEGERDPAVASSYGVGLLMLGAVESGARTLYVGLGGSGTNDGGAGLLAAVGVVAYDAAGVAVGPGPLALLGAERIEGFAALRTASVVAATDVDSPLLGPDGATAVFGPQKGVTPEQIPVFEQALARYAELLERDRKVTPAGLGQLPGGGAAGGMGAALFALRGKRRSGFDVVASALGLSEQIADADLVVTGEGRFDEQSVRGKVPAGVAALAAQHAVPCIVLAGDVTLGRRQLAAYSIDEAHSMVEYAGADRAMGEAADVLTELAESAARAWLR